MRSLNAVALEGRLLPEGAGVVAAVSGGRDSMVVLDWLGRWRERMAWRVVVAHFNHGLRGAEADADERWVGDVAATKGMTFVAGRGDVSSARAGGESWEAAGRRLRHAFLASVARDHGFGFIATGHHGGDQTELFLLRLLRGAGPAGLAGMSACDPSPANPSLRLIRPLLELSGEEVEALAIEWGVKFREDATNRDSTFMRNRIRHELLPLLRDRFQPGIDRVLRREQILLGDQAEVIRRWAEDWLGGAAGGTRGNQERFEDLAPALQREVLRIQAERFGVVMEFEDFEALRARAETPVQISPSQRLVRDAEGGLQILAGGPAELNFGAARNEVRTLAGAGLEMFASGILEWSVTPRESRSVGSGSAVGDEVFDADAVGPQFVLRHWQPGDRFEPIGLGAAAKLQDLFTNARIPGERRRECVVAETTDGRIFWVEDLRIGECAKISDCTSRLLHWHWSRPGAAVDGAEASR